MSQIILNLNFSFSNVLIIIPANHQRNLKFGFYLITSIPRTNTHPGKADGQSQMQMYQAQEIWRESQVFPQGRVN